MTLNELITSNEKNAQEEIKKAFMPYSPALVIGDQIPETITILLNLSLKNPVCKDYLDINRAKKYFANPKHLSIAIGEIEYVHSHNVKFPDSRVRHQRLFVKSAPRATHQTLKFHDEALYGWSHNAATYRHTIWLLSTFIWNQKQTNLLTLISAKEPTWLAELKKFGLKKEQASKIIDAAAIHLSSDSLPEEVSVYSKQVRFVFGYDNYDEIAITPVASHSIQVALEQAYRIKPSKFKFTQLTLPSQPKPVAVGNLPGSLGGNMTLLFYPALQSWYKKHALKKINNGANILDTYQVTNRTMQNAMVKILDKEAYLTKNQRQKARKIHIKRIKEQLIHWLIPAIQLRDEINSGEKKADELYDWLVQDFISLKANELPSLDRELNNLLQLTLQKNKYTRKLAYHPVLMKLTKIQLTMILQELAETQNVANHAEEQFIYLKSIRAEQLNAMSCPYLCGAPSFTAIWGFVYRYQLQFIDIAGFDDVIFDSFAFFVRGEEITTTAKLTEPNKLIKKTEISYVKNPTIHSQKYSDIEFDIVIKVRSARDLAGYKAQLKASLPTTLAGGSVFPPKLAEGIDWVDSTDDKNFLHLYIKTLPTYGRWLVPSSKETLSVEAFETLLGSNRGLIPVMSGFRFLETPQERLGSICKLHTYAENILSLAKRVNPIEFRFNDKHHFFKQAFWSYKAELSSIFVSKAAS